MSLLNETWYENADGTGGYYFADKDIHGKNPITITYRQARQKDFFEDAVLNPNSPYYKGDLARFAYEHNIGLHFTSEKSFALWISDESHYARDKFFYVDNFMGKKSTAFQLRVSNHPTIHAEWEKMHAGHKDVRAEFCLTLLINPYGRSHEKADGSRKTPVTCLQCDISDYYNGMPKDRVEFIDKFVNAVTAGEQPHITIDDIRFMGGGVEPVETHSGPQGLQHGEHNFQTRPNLSLYNKNYAFIEKQEEPVQNETPDHIPFEVVDGINLGDTFEYKGQKYRYVIQDDEFYGVPVKKIRTRSKNKEKQEMEYDDEAHKIIIERKIKVGMQDIMEMVKKCLRLLV